MFRYEVKLEYINNKEEIQIKEQDLNGVIDAIIDEYTNNSLDNCADLGEFLDSITINGLSIESVAVVYACIYRKLTGYETFRKSKYTCVNLADYNNGC